MLCSSRLAQHREHLPLSFDVHPSNHMTPYHVGFPLEVCGAQRFALLHFVTTLKRMLRFEDASPARLDMLLSSSVALTASLQDVLGTAVAQQVPAGVNHVFVRLPGGKMLSLKREVSQPPQTEDTAAMPTLPRPSLVRGHESGTGRARRTAV